MNIPYPSTDAQLRYYPFPAQPAPAMFLATDEEARETILKLRESRLLDNDPRVLPPPPVAIDGRDYLGGTFIPGTDGRRPLLLTWWEKNDEGGLEQQYVWVQMIHHRMRELTTTGNAMDFEARLLRKGPFGLWA